MTEEHAQYVLSCREAGAPAPVLTGVHANGRLDAVLFELTLRQTYRNSSDQVLEVVYTFPLPTGAVLLGFASELNGLRQEGVIVAKREAERQYEASLEDGDAPVMLESLGNGLHTANVGNLKPGDEVALECRFVQLLSFEQGRLRLTIPTTVAPRYGQAEQAGIQPQQAPLASLDVEYPFALTLILGESLAGASADFPTHRFTTSHGTDGSTRLDLSPGARMDRDVVVVVTPNKPHPSLLIRSTDTFEVSAPAVAMAALQPPPGTPRASIAIKLLVDCSGSMAGDGIRSARATLGGLIRGLTEHDHVSLSRFGSTVDHLFAPSMCTPQVLGHMQLLIKSLDADMGGTEMEDALTAVIELPIDRDRARSDVLLITDGNIWQAEEVVASARSSGHRVFAIGVGASPTEGVLRTLAESTGGACEFATPGEALDAAAQRMLFRMRQPVFTNIRIDWGATPVWEVAPSGGLFGGDMAIAFAGFGEHMSVTRARLIADDTMGQTVQLACTEVDAPCLGDSLARIAAARRLAQSADGDANGLALMYQLMSTTTNCILVHQRAEADKAAQQAELHRVSSMLSAGWGGMGTIDSPSLSYSFSSPVLLSQRTSLRSAEAIRFSADYSEIASSPAADTVAEPSVSPSLEDMARAVGSHLLQGGQLGEFLIIGGSLPLHTDVQWVLQELVTLGLPLESAWVLLTHWVNTRAGGLGDDALTNLLQPLLAAVGPAQSLAATSVLERQLGGYANSSWAISRQQRLRRMRCRAHA